MLFVGFFDDRVFRRKFGIVVVVGPALGKSMTKCFQKENKGKFGNTSDQLLDLQLTICPECSSTGDDIPKSIHEKSKLNTLSPHHDKRQERSSILRDLLGSRKPIKILFEFWGKRLSGPSIYDLGTYHEGVPKLVLKLIEEGSQATKNYAKVTWQKITRLRWNLSLLL